MNSAKRATTSGENLPETEGGDVPEHAVEESGKGDDAADLNGAIEEALGVKTLTEMVEARPLLALLVAGVIGFVFARYTAS